LKYFVFVLQDEPTNNLDIESIDALSDAINTYKGGKLTIDLLQIKATKHYLLTEILLMILGNDLLCQTMD